MIGYGTAKAAVHQLVHSLAASGSGLPRDSVVVGIMPETLDTPANRAGMPNADFSNWTPCEEVADKLHQWTTKASAPQNGGLLKITTRGGATKYEYA
jgi:dihydropteridine reductase